jgi:hypothetical protein
LVMSIQTDIIVSVVSQKVIGRTLTIYSCCPFYKELTFGPRNELQHILADDELKKIFQ